MVEQQVLPLTTEVFWKYIETIDRAALARGDEDGAVKPLTDHLARCNEDELDAFDERLAKMLYDLDTRAHMAEAGDSSDSSDGFLYVRCYVVASGREFYESVLKDPTLTPKSLDHWLEPLLYVSRAAWEQATGDERDYYASVDYETGSNDAGWAEEA